MILFVRPEWDGWQSQLPCLSIFTLFSWPSFLPIGAGLVTGWSWRKEPREASRELLLETSKGQQRPAETSQRLLHPPSQARCGPE